MPLDTSRAVSATRIVWDAAGQPAPHDATGMLIPASRTQGERCARCGVSDAPFHRSSLLSSNFLPTRNANRLAAFGGEHYCHACTFAAKTLRLRCSAWFASADGVSFWRTRSDSSDDDALLSLLTPPSPPFVASIPLYGIAHGGETHWRRTWWPGEPRHEELLVKLQSKHVALYARAATSGDRFPVQVDDDKEFVLDRDLWLRLRGAATEAAALLFGHRVPSHIVRRAMLRLRCPSGLHPFGVREWSRLIAPLEPHRENRWWPIFAGLLRLQEKP